MYSVWQSEHAGWKGRTEGVFAVPLSSSSTRGTERFLGLVHHFEVLQNQASHMTVVP